MENIRKIPKDWIEVYERSLENLSKDNRVRRFIANLAYLETRQRMECAEYFDRELVENAEVSFSLVGQHLQIELVMPGETEFIRTANIQAVGRSPGKLH